MPKDLKSVLGMSKVTQLLVDQGFNDNLMHKIYHQNWLKTIKRILK
jgi:microsomal dipeptidase-like Zn-dependent dipeptidase